MAKVTLISERTANIGSRRLVTRLCSAKITRNATRLRRDGRREKPSKIRQNIET
ncbi:MAG TPA: hypothetical protein VGC77_23285 [Rhodopseudomonas sp.]|uniref:hypothetical protein n=1 Tax=Rhodopseudomonas sp. TaxID=1078 RepID=UPI002ED9FA45